MFKGWKHTILAGVGGSLVPSTHISRLQLLLSPVPGDLVLSSGLSVLSLTESHHVPRSSFWELSSEQFKHCPCVPVAYTQELITCRVSKAAHLFIDCSPAPSETSCRLWTWSVAEDDIDTSHFPASVCAWIYQPAWFIWCLGPIPGLHAH